MDNLESTQPFGLPIEEVEPSFKIFTGKYFTWISSAVTDVGTMRKVNEDSMLEYPEKRIWVVADGMGGHDAGDIASQTTVSFLRNVDYDAELSVFANNVEDCLLAANEKLFRMGKERGQLAGSTVVTLLAHERHCLVIWAGDSRLYRYREGLFERVTRDHSHVEELVQLGQITAEEAESHPQANVITRAVGANADLFLEMEVLEVQENDAFLLCSDGLYKELAEDEIGTIVADLPPSRAARRLIDVSLQRGARDNVTVIVLRVQANR